MNVSVLRLHNQHLISPLSTPDEVVSWFGAMQAQDFAAAKWAIALRSQHQTDATIEQAFNEGRILRTHIMRPTWHFVSPKDIHWILALTAPRVHKFNGYYYRKSGLTKDIFQKSNAVIRKALEEGKQLTRSQLGAALDNARIPTRDLGLTYTILQAELDGIICSGPRVNKQFTYMILDKRVPKGNDMEHDEAVGELTKRYFQSHGPAQIQDFMWWSGLTGTDAKRGIDIAKLKKEIIGNKVYWTTKHTEMKQTASVYLIPPFDEYFVAYKDRSDIIDGRYKRHMNFNGGMINGAIISKGIIIGTWKRVFEKKEIIITIHPFSTFENEEYKEITKAADRYGHFHSLRVVMRN
ncbi:MAG TPA: winged helix DNA-binding domain-containing protein [Patescibacteria group bacterium]|nr:winged helix DNA-binding domain-containing protein [Patescibacteria group bacterium]